MRTIAAMCLCLLSASAHADALTCESFKAILAQSLLDNGDKVGLPSGSRLIFQPEGNEGHRFIVAGVVGVKGDLNCVDNDVFESFNIHSDNEDADDREIVSRILRVLAISTAATCVTDPAPARACDRRVKELFLQGYDRFDDARRRGDPRPGSSQTLDVSPESRAELSLTPDGAFFTVRTRPQ